MFTNVLFSLRFSLLDVIFVGILLSGMFYTLGVYFCTKSIEKENRKNIENGKQIKFITADKD